MAKKSVREQRRLTAVNAKMRVDDACVDIVIANASNGGLMGKCDTPPSVGTRVEILRRSMRITGSVTWTLGRRFGVRVDEPIDLDGMLASGLRDNQTTTEAGVVRKSWWHWRS